MVLVRWLVLTALLATACGGTAASPPPPHAPPNFGANVAPATSAQRADVLGSWNDGASRQAIIAFVERVTREGGPEFVPVAARIAVFDNDGTLWSEQPIYTQVAFAFDRVKALAPQHP